jgi:hypothetical protein
MASVVSAATVFEDSFPGTTLDASKWAVATSGGNPAVAQNGSEAVGTEFAFVYAYGDTAATTPAYASMTTQNSFSIGSGLKVTTQLLFPAWATGQNNYDTDWHKRPSFDILNAATGTEQMVVYAAFSNNAWGGLVYTAYPNGGAMQSHNTPEGVATGSGLLLETTLYTNSFTSKIYNSSMVLVDEWSGTYDTISSIKLRYMAREVATWPASCVIGDNVMIESVPEPFTLGFLTLGGLWGVWKRKR